MTSRHVAEINADQTVALARAAENCVNRFGPSVLSDHRNPFFNETTKNWMCPAYWDTITCWPNSEANSMVSVFCPSYVLGYIDTNYATRFCNEEGKWFVNSVNKTWTNYSACYSDDTTTVIRDLKPINVTENLKAIYPPLKILSETGYAMSLFSLIFAFAIMFFIKKLHCSRNILHMNLFASFILRASSLILKDILFVEGIGFAKDVISINGSLYFHYDPETNNFECKTFISLIQYFTTANYSWILMEGLYLNNLIFRALFADSSRNILHYIILGWGLPVIVVVPWAAARVLFEDEICWTLNENYWVYLIMGIPTVISVLINFVLFIIISIVLYTKLRSPINEDSQRYRKWAKSTLVLVPLFGVHYAVLLIFYFVGQTTIWMVSDIIFGSFQGFFVALLFCFLNGEVKAELKPLIYNTLTFLATHSFFKYFFPCRHRYLRSSSGRQSVCTTMSCSSLYQNGILRRNSRSKWDIFPKQKHFNSSDKLAKDHVCYNSKRGSRSLSRTSQNSLNMFSNRPTIASNAIPINQVETALNNDKNYSTDTLTIEELTMLSKR